jgi:hypothetical protein
MIAFTLNSLLSRQACRSVPQRRIHVRPCQATAFLMSPLILASVAASSEVMFHTTGCMWPLSSCAGFSASPKPHAMKSLPVLM